ncbi:DUF55-domain-containing protein [Hypoxylon fragiforme]|uniref:DUF55-domain-containing protein n=1 Tax=Hypoxylon fragiforme TaxID=63214 RepID=UPI0020C63BCE|nr:DUF55-domain-containing protein [Hypoxylon fragiforme]KAI2603448.1 DUF55-domain-containing protein [Hypoxylon fragiforme]
MVKRKASQIAAVQPDTDTTTLRRSTRRKPSEPATQASDSGVAKPESDAPKAAKAVKAKGAVKKEDIKVSPPKPKAKPKTSKDTQLPSTTAGEASDSSERSYWLMKAEPESRFENGTDVKFSIDDLASRTEPEPWDGIRNYAARNNLRAMKKGDIAFFYHSNCKEPGIVGTMEVVQEHSPDVSAHDPKAPYYDASSKPDEPKWSVVHVKFHSKFKQQIGLKELREMGKPGQPLESMQMIKQSRLSVSRVSATEFEYLMGIIRERGGEIS